MKATELMIGDWVCYDGDTCYSCPIKIEGMDVSCDFCITSDRDNAGFKGVIPIPLTARILEKNGINKRGDEYVIYGWDGAEQWHVFLKDFKPQFNYWFISSSDRDLNVRGKIRYVHELQHALRLCGLNDLADNFKV